MEQQEMQITLRNILFLILVLPMLARAQLICSKVDVNITENNAPGDVVATIETINEGITLAFQDPPPNNPFTLEGKRLIANSPLDREETAVYTIAIRCTNPADNDTLDILAIIEVLNVNDEAPTFPQSLYTQDVNEFTAVDSVIGTFPATDKDSSQLYYNLVAEPDVGFGLQAPTSARIVVTSTLDYEVIQHVKLTLHARDTAEPSPGGDPSFSASTTIMINIVDVDNRTPWFQPCAVVTVGLYKICRSSGYTGSVTLTEQKEGALTLEPGPVQAVDGDTGIKEIITYSILDGNPDNLFQINPNTGNITMTRPADVLGPILLTVMATQAVNTYQMATTTVRIQVVNKSLAAPVFERSTYSGVVTGLGSMVMDPTDSTPLLIRATDADFSGGENPGIVYELFGSRNFSLIGGRLFMTSDSPLGAVSLQVEARDPAVGDVTRAEVMVEVTTGLPTTTSAPQTNGTAVPTTDPSTTAEPTSSPSGSTLDTNATEPSVTTQGSVATDPTTRPHAAGTGTYNESDMAILGATLGVILLIALGVIGFLAYRVQKGKAAWEKLSEASVFRSALGRGPGGLKDGVQYTNEAFKNDEDSDSTGSAGRAELSRRMSEEPAAASAAAAARITAAEAAASRFAASLLAALPEEEAGEGDGDSEKEVKPILTKERRTEEGYKSVWFKEDIVPDAKEDVHIIPDNGERDAEEDEDEDEEELSGSGNEDEEDVAPRRNVLFGDADEDSGLGVKALDSASDSENNEMVTSDL